MKNRFLICAVALTGASGLAAADEVGQWYLTPQAGYLWSDGKRNVDDDWTHGLSLGNHFAQKWNFELNYNHADLDAEAPGTGSLQLDELSANFQRLFGEAALQPYWTIGAGGLRTQGTAFANNSTTGLLAQSGLGLLWRMSDRVALRTEAKARWNAIGSDTTDYLGMLGLQIGLGSPRKAAEPTPPPPPPPPPEPATPPPPPPPPADSDNDGVLDTNDRCPGTPPGVAVDVNGCTRKGSATLEGVTFEFNSATLTSDSNAVLQPVAADLKKYPRLKIELQGHTDSVGKDAYNLRLSQRRAEAVRDYLIGQGVPAGQMTAKGYGETKPAADNKTEEGRAQNRRVVMEVLDNPGDVQVKGEGEAQTTAN